MIIGGLYWIRISRAGVPSVAFRVGVYCGRSSKGSDNLMFCTFVASKGRFTDDLRPFSREQVMGAADWTPQIQAAYQARIARGDQAPRVPYVHFLPPALLQAALTGR